MERIQLDRPSTSILEARVSNEATYLPWFVLKLDLAG